ncbi:MAG TPA: hypothetical protein VF060_26035 [Trebonia sp.]
MTRRTLLRGVTGTARRMRSGPLRERRLRAAAEGDADRAEADG